MEGGKGRTLLPSVMPARCMGLASWVAQGSVLGPVLFNVSASLMVTPSCVVWLTRLRDGMPSRGTLTRFDRWACANFVKFNKAGCKVLHMGQGNPKHNYRLGREWIESSPEDKDLVLLVDEKLSMTQECALTA